MALPEVRDSADADRQVVGGAGHAVAFGEDLLHTSWRALHEGRLRIDEESGELVTAHARQNV